MVSRPMHMRLSRRELVQGALSGLIGATLLPAMAQRAMGGGRLVLSRRPAFAVPLPTPFSSSLELDLAAHRQLLRFYRQAGADAVLAVGSTGEMLSITWPEALRLVRSASAVFGPSRTWASLSVGRSVESCRRGAADLHQAGAGLPVVIPGLLAGAGSTEAEAERLLLEVGRGIPGPLGLYESINPFHRTLPAPLLAALAAQGSFQLLKTTQGAPQRMAALVAAVPRGFLILEANTADLFAVLQAGAAGVLDFCAACFPELLAYLCRSWADPKRRSSLQPLCRWIGDTDALLLGSLAFPRGVKAVLAARGLAIQPFSRQAVADLTRDQNAQVQDLVRQFRSLSRDLGITPLL
ncbi:MAG: dihydrodipicolinate synthase family protein [Chitinophagaceae bacterium]|nr:dihydrodipicolinate synthase family protein [Chitinophagaceae bacterium]